MWAGLLFIFIWRPSKAIMLNSPLPATVPIYLQDDHCFEHEARLLGIGRDALVFDQTCFYPGGGGQPPDRGRICFSPAGPTVLVSSAHMDESGVIWHISPASQSLPGVHAGQVARLMVDAPCRLSLMRTHTVLHILNSIVLKDYQAWITGVQISEDRARIDFNFKNLNAQIIRELEQKVNQIINAGHALKAYYLSEARFKQRPDLLRTLDVQPPVHAGQVRVVEISGFDAQACGGTHVHNTAELGIFSIQRTENKGRNNKRLYIQLAQA